MRTFDGISFSPFTALPLFRNSYIAHNCLVSLNGADMLSAGGMDNSGLIKKAYLYDGARGFWSMIADMPTARYGSYTTRTKT